MPKLVLEVELDYPDTIHGDDPEAFLWFRDEILLGAGEDGRELVLHSNEIGDEIGTVKVRSIVRKYNNGELPQPNRDPITMRKVNARVAVFWDEERGWTAKIVHPSNNQGGFGDMAGQALITLTAPEAAGLPY